MKRKQEKQIIRFQIESRAARCQWRVAISHKAFDVVQLATDSLALLPEHEYKYALGGLQNEGCPRDPRG